MTLQDLFQLRCASAEWLQANPNNPNAAAIRAALENTSDEALEHSRRERIKARWEREWKEIAMQPLGL